jgi:glycosyltransferase involved in cell wall biosynthesis
MGEGPNSPAISVVMSVYNGEAFLAKSVESILNQTFGDFEFIIINDGSTDKTAEILSEYVKRDQRVRVFPQQNRGRAESLNRGIQLAKADLIARMDADDVSLPNRFIEQLKFMNAHPEVGLLGAAIEWVTPEGPRLLVEHLPIEDGALRATMLRSNPFRHPTIMMRKDIVLSLGGYRKVLLDADDYDLWLRMAERTQLANLAHALVLYRVHPNQASVKNMRHQILCCSVARAAASLRARRIPDPLWNAEKITPDFALKLGVTADQIRRNESMMCLHWIQLLSNTRADWILPIVQRLLELRPSPAERRLAARVLLQAAGTYLRHGRLTTAFAAAGRGILAQPLEAFRMMGMTISRRARDVQRPLARLR